MEAKELRLGNIVKCYSPETNDIVPFEVNSLNLDMVRLINSYDDFEIMVDRVEPIELTEDILNSCKNLKGYHNNSWWIGNRNQYYLKVGIFGLMLWHRVDDNYSSMYRVVYLHELQNLFFLIQGEELDIDIDKITI